MAMVHSYRVFVLLSVSVLLGVVSSLRLIHNVFGTSPAPNSSGSISTFIVRRANGLSSFATSNDMGPATPLLAHIGKKKDMKLGVMLLNLGGPEKIEDVQGFLYNLFADPDIIRLPSFLSPLQRPLAYFISKSRAKKSSEAYESIGGGSPIVKYTNQQAQLLKDELVKRGFQRNNVHCYVAMRYWAPFTETAVEQLIHDKIDSLVILPLYPQYSISTSGSSLRLLNQIFEQEKYRTIFNNNITSNNIDINTKVNNNNNDMIDNNANGETHQVRHTVVSHWYQRPGYLRSVARLILQQVAQYETPLLAEGVHVLFSAHGVPESYIQAGDPYEQQMRHCVALVEEEVKRLLQWLHHKVEGETPYEATLSEEEKHMWQEIRQKLDKNTALQLAGVLSSNISDNPTDNTANDNNNIPKMKFHLSFQSRVGPIQWLQPYTEDTLKRLGDEEKVKSLVVVPISFVSEHVETLEEIDQEYRELALEHGVTHWRRVPALNLDAGFLGDLGQLVDEAVQDKVVSVQEALRDNLVTGVSRDSLFPVRPQNLIKAVNKVVASGYGQKLLLGGSVGVAAAMLMEKMCRMNKHNNKP